jgi:hypothetical protein
MQIVGNQAQMTFGERLSLAQSIHARRIGRIKKRNGIGDITTDQHSQKLLRSDQVDSGNQTNSPATNPRQ